MAKPSQNMKKILVRQASGGNSGWSVEPEELDAYFEHVARHWNFISRLWYWFRPELTDYRFAYEHGGRLWIHTPTHQMMALLKRGDVIRHMRQIDSLGPSGIPVFDGSGEFLSPMTELEAIEFLTWKDIPREVNRRVILKARDIPQDRSHRNDWRLTETGIAVT